MKTWNEQQLTWHALRCVVWWKSHHMIGYHLYHREKIRTNQNHACWSCDSTGLFRAISFSSHFDHVICFFLYVKIEESRGERLQIAGLSLNGPFVWCLVFQFCSRKVILNAFLCFRRKWIRRSWLAAGSSIIWLTVVCKWLAFSDVLFYHDSTVSEVALERFFVIVSLLGGFSGPYFEIGLSKC